MEVTATMQIREAGQAARATESTAASRRSLLLIPQTLFEVNKSVRTRKDRIPSLWVAVVGLRDLKRGSGVCTLCTPWTANPAVPPPDWAGFRMFSRVASVQGLECSSSPTTGAFYHVRGPFGPLSVCTLLDQCGSDRCPRRAICNCGWPFCGPFLPSCRRRFRLATPSLLGRVVAT